MILCPLALNLPYSFDMHGIHNSNMYYNESQLYLYPYQEYMYMQVHKPYSLHNMKIDMDAK